MNLNEFFRGNYTLYSIMTTVVILLMIYFVYYDWKYEMNGEPFVSGMYDPQKSSNWVYFPVFGQRVSRTGVAYYNHPFHLYLRNYKVYANVADVLKSGTARLIAATKAAAVPVPKLPIAPIAAIIPKPSALTSNAPAVPNTGKKAIVTIPTTSGPQQVIAPVVTTNGTDKAIVSLPTKNGHANIAVTVPSVSKTTLNFATFAVSPSAETPTIVVV
jgi:hypothetical protein